MWGGANQKKFLVEKRAAPSRSDWMMLHSVDRPNACVANFPGASLVGDSVVSGHWPLATLVFGVLQLR